MEPTDWGHRPGTSVVEFYRLPGLPEPESDLVNHPPHYKSGGLESIEVIEAFGLNFHLGNVIKYVLRAERKGNAIQDLDKASWYLKREIERRKKESQEKAPQEGQDQTDKA